MGNTGSYTQKATLPPSLLTFSKWGSEEIKEFFLRGHRTLSESFGLKRGEFEFLLGKDLVEFKTMRSIFTDVFDTDSNNTVDKMEVMCAIFLTSKIANQEKIHFFFELFNFNNKGYLYESEIILMLLAITRGAYKVDQKYHPPAINTIAKLAKNALSNANVDPSKQSLRKPELVTIRNAAERFRSLAEKNQSVLGRGHLQQGILADRYLLNALAAMTGRPDLITCVFATTKQEDFGRFSIRFFEGCGWRNVYVDDRVPCGPNGEPIFCSSSDHLEAWPLLLEKAVAKYFGGSYGLIALCSGRPDATLFMLKLLTGGHVTRLFSSSFDWVSVSSDVPFGREDGAAAVQRLLDEGSSVSFGCSEARSMMTRGGGGTSAEFDLTKTSGDATPPYGRLFPLLAVETQLSGFKFLVFRDPWGLMTNGASNDGAAARQGDAKNNRDNDNDNDLLYADKLTGHCNTFRIAVESVPRLFDTVVLSRFPDSLRDRTQRLGIPQWETKILNQITKSASQPARFMLTVKKTVNETLDRKRKKFVPPKVNDDKESSEVKVERVEEEVPVPPDENDLVDVALTVSSSCDWLVAGSDICRPKLRLRIVPSPATLATLVARDDQSLKYKKHLSDLEKSKKAILAARLALEKTSIGVSPEETPTGDATTQEDPIITDNNNNDSSNIGNGINEGKSENVGLGKDSGRNEEAKGQATDREKEGRGVSASKKQLRCFDVNLTSESSWLSHSIKLFPGEYCVLVDVSFDIPYPAAFQLSLPKDRMDTPWFDFYEPPADAPTAKFNRVADSDDRSVGDRSAPSVTFSMLSPSSSMKRLATEIKRLAAADTAIEHNIWLQASTLESANVDPFVAFTPSPDPVPSASKDVKIGSVSTLEDLQVQPATGPFMSESQLEVSSRELSVLLTKIKGESVSTGAHLVSLMSKYRDMRSSELRATYIQKKKPNNNKS
eukprot:gene30911-40229_t